MNKQHWSIMLALVSVGCSGGGAEQAREGRAPLILADGTSLHYRAYDLPATPPGYYYYRPQWISLAGEAYSVGDIDCDNGSCRWDAIKVDAAGNFSVLAQDFLVGAVDAAGDVGGCTAPRDANGQHTLHAAVLHADGRLESLPTQPGEQSSCVELLSDGGSAAYVSVTSSSGSGGSYVWFHGAALPVVLPPYPVPQDLNDRGELVGRVGSPPQFGAFRYDATSGTTSLLPPAACDQEADALATNALGGVLGYSFTQEGESRIVAWDAANQLTSVFESAADYPDRLGTPLWNDSGLVIVSHFGGGPTYLFPEPGVRADLADLLADPEDATDIIVLDINDHGDFLAADGARSRLFLRDD
jgi:hypothetical protein